MADLPKLRTVGELMSSPVVTALPDETVAEASARMRDHRVGAVVVVDGDRPVGILTERDLVRWGAAGVDPGGSKVAEWMTGEPDTVAPGRSVQEAYDSLAAHGYRHIPVVDDGRLVGIVSMRDLLRVASIQPVVHPSTIEAPPGLEGVIVAETSVGDVRGLEGFYHYRQYSAVELADKRRLEDVWFLLFEGRLPSAAERDAFLAEVRPLRRVPAAVAEVLPAIAAGSKSIMEGVRTAVSLVGAVEGYRPTLDIDHAERRRNALQLCAVIPTLIMAVHRLRAGEEPVDPRDDLGYGANYLWMMSGSEPDTEAGRGVEQYQMTTIDHGFNASTFTARVVTSTGADVAAAVVAGIGALSGPLHGGAPSRALDLLDAIGTVDNARPYLVDAVTRGEKIMGFGHRVYKTEDPRATHLRKMSKELAEASGDDTYFRMSRQMEQVVFEEKGLYPNVDFYAATVYHYLGIPTDLFTPVFSVSRMSGWTAHVIEQHADNRLIRPRAEYVSPAAR
jgi:citrate synthase